MDQQTPFPSPLRHLDIQAISDAARREARRRESALPPVSVFRWWARRTEAVVGGIVDAVGHDQTGRLIIADPFAGGGTIALVAATRGHRVFAQDVNPWSVQGLATTFRLPPPRTLRAAQADLEDRLTPTLSHAYTTETGPMAFLLRVRTAICPACGEENRYYPQALVTMLQRVDTGATRGWLACPRGHLTLGETHTPIRCNTCRALIDPRGRYMEGGRYGCGHCRWTGGFEALVRPTWIPALIGTANSGATTIREPDPEDLARCDEEAWNPLFDLGAINIGEETRRLLRRGFGRWSELYPNRQRWVIEQALSATAEVAGSNESLRLALTMATLGTAEFAGHLSRWDARYLKPYEVIANHRLYATHLPAEINVWGSGVRQRGSLTLRLESLIRAAEWNQQNLKQPSVCVRWSRRTAELTNDVTIVKGSSARIPVPDATFDLILTDPPYHDDIQYGELSELFRAWLGRGRGPSQLNGDITVGERGCAPEKFRRELASVFAEAKRTLKPTGRMIISFANRDPEAWVALVGALADTGFHVAGYTWVHAENEVDHVKRGRCSATLDMLIDLVAVVTDEVHRPARVGTSEQETFLDRVGTWLTRVHHLDDGWEECMRNDLRQLPFAVA